MNLADWPHTKQSVTEKMESLQLYEMRLLILRELSSPAVVLGIVGMLWFAGSENQYLSSQ